MIELIKNKYQCCGCGICAYTCSKNAITMSEDNEGFIYPEIDTNKCVECGLCVKNCSFGKVKTESPLKTFAGKNTNAAQRIISTSAGIFSAVADGFLKSGGYVCGAAMEKENEQFYVRHRLIKDEDELAGLQGSKYVQSSAYYSYGYIEEKLKLGAEILFSGTPCQVGAFKAYFGRRYPGQIYVIDIICHGVPNLKFFNDYIKNVERTKNVVLTQ